MQINISVEQVLFLNLESGAGWGTNVIAIVLVLSKSAKKYENASKERFLMQKL